MNRSAIVSLLLVLGTCNVGTAAGPDPALVGQWEGPYDWPVVSIHAFLLPTGKVLHFSFPGEIAWPASYVWDPATLEFTPVPVNRPLFCSGHSYMADGRILITGGNGPAPPNEFRGIKDTHIFDPFDETWSRVEDMADGRWYPTNVTLADGRVLTFSGLDELTGAINTDVELYEPGSGLGWEIVSNVDLPLYPRMFMLSTGDVFYAGPSRVTGTYDTDTGTWYGIMDSNYGGRYSGTFSQIPGQQDAVMIIGGQDGGVITETAEIIDLSASSPAWQYTQPMNFPRLHTNAVILPDGKVMVVCGLSEQLSEEAGGGPATPVLEAELYDPTTGTWSVMAPMSVPRQYHATALLLPDARVLVAGSDGQYNAEIFSPPYLFRGPQPVIDSAPAKLPYGESFVIGTQQAATISSVVLIRLSTVTHSVNMSQRYVDLEFMSLGPDTLEGVIAANAALAPPGYYMLFIVDADGVPSVASMVQLVDSIVPSVPTISTWGMIAFTLLLLVAGTIVTGRSGSRVILEGPE